MKNTHARSQQLSPLKSAKVDSKLLSIGLTAHKDLNGNVAPWVVYSSWAINICFVNLCTANFLRTKLCKSTSVDVEELIVHADSWDI